jgi:hypothetical protein
MRHDGGYALIGTFSYNTQDRLHLAALIKGRVDIVCSVRAILTLQK